MNLVRKRQFGVNWILIFFHNSTTGQWFNDITALHYIDSTNPFMYSIIGDMKNKHKYKGFYEYFI